VWDHCVVWSRFQFMIRNCCFVIGLGSRPRLTFLIDHHISWSGWVLLMWWDTMATKIRIVLRISLANGPTPVSQEVVSSWGDWLLWVNLVAERAVSAKAYDLRSRQSWSIELIEQHHCHVIMVWLRFYHNDWALRRWKGVIESQASEQVGNKG